LKQFGTLLAIENSEEYFKAVKIHQLIPSPLKGEGQGEGDLLGASTSFPPPLYPLPPGEGNKS
jgi:hypothetical protein